MDCGGWGARASLNRVHFATRSMLGGVRCCEVVELAGTARASRSLELVSFSCTRLNHLLILRQSSHHHSFMPDHYMSRLGVCLDTRTCPECRRLLHRARALEERGLRSVGFPFTLTHLRTDWFIHYAFFFFFFFLHFSCFY